MNDAERHKILVVWNQTARDYPRDKCVHELFEEQAERTPESVAVVFGGQTLTYRELNGQANQLARYLRTLGVQAETPVALCLERSFHPLVAILAILKAGGVYVPIDPVYPRDRMEFMLKDAGISVLIVHAATISLVPSPSPAVTYVDLDRISLAGEPADDFPSPNNAPDNAAYIIFTSGSTGQPKGVVVTHRNVVRLFSATEPWFGFGETDVWTLFHSLAFDFSVWEIWGALLYGGRLVVVPYWVSRTPADFYQLLLDEGVTVLNQTPSAFGQLIPIAVGAPVSTELKLRWVIFGGEALQLGMLTPWFARLGDESPCLVNMYGITETTVHVTWRPLKQADVTAKLGSIIGRPIPDLTLHLLDEKLQPVATGVSGEIFVGGLGVARGYLNRPALNAERFLPDPFSTIPGARLYRSGDLACRLEDGEFVYLGRADQQVKIRGFRIELGEVENALHRHPDIQQAAVLARPGPDGALELASWIVLCPGRELTLSRLRSELSRWLPEYMIPGSFTVAPDLPLNPNGKVDRRALEKMEGAHLIAGSSFEAPRTDTERQLCGIKPEIAADVTRSKVSQPINLLELEMIRIWQRILQQDNISRQDNFFMLGGHSLLAARLAAEIDRVFGCNLPIATLFQSPTVESLAKRMTDENWAPPWSCLVPLQPAGSRPPLFFIHGVGGDVYLFLSLTRLLPPEQPSYGIQAVGLDGKSLRHISVVEMAAHYVEEIMSFQTEGPIHLAGFSLGGIIAFEIAQQLHCRGRKVAFLGLLDSCPIGPVPWLFYGLSMSSYIPRRCLFHLRHWLQLPHYAKLDYFCGRLIALRHWVFANQKKPAPVIEPPPACINPPEFAGFIDYYHAIGSTYRLSPYPDSADVFLSDEICPQWKWYWRYLVRGGVTFHRVTGGHNDLINNPDHIPLLAMELADALDHARVAVHASKCV